MVHLQPRPLRRQAPDGQSTLSSASSSPSPSLSSSSAQSSSSAPSSAQSSSSSQLPSTSSSSSVSSTTTTTAAAESSSSSSTASSSSSSSTTSSTSTTSTTATTAPLLSPNPTPSVEGASTSFVIQLTSASGSESYNPTPSLSLASATPGGGSLSGGAVIGICVLAGLAGFAMLFWVGVKLTQMKRRKQENEEMDRIDFDPGNGSADGDYYTGALPLPRSKGSDDMRENTVDYLGGAGHRDLAEIAFEDEQDRKEREQIYDDYMHSMTSPVPVAPDSGSIHTMGSGGNRAGVGVAGLGRQVYGRAHGGSLSRQPTSGRYDMYEGGYAAAAANPIMYGSNTQYGYNNDYNNPFAGPTYATAPDHMNRLSMRQVNHYRHAGSETRSLTPEPSSVYEHSAPGLQRSDSVGTAKEDVGNGVGRLMLVQH